MRMRNCVAVVRNARTSVHGMYRIGQKVRIVMNSRSDRHSFKKGEIVKIIGVDDKDKKLPYCVESADNLSWVRDCEIEAIRKAKKKGK